MSTTQLLQGEDQFCALPNGDRLCYRSFGDQDATPLILVVGLGMQLIFWPPLMVSGLVDAGFRVIVLDNRDVGRSSRMSTPAPSFLQIVRRRAPAGAYDLGDMAGDVVALMDHLGIGKAHLVGMSMGGMIAQTIAARWPERALSLTSIFSTTGARKVGQPALSSMRLVLAPPAKTREAAMARYRRIANHIGSTRFPMRREIIDAYANEAWDRGTGPKDPLGVARQIAAIMKSGNRTREVRRIKAPTLVIHGDQDLMVAPSGGYATADAIDGARLVLISGMGHFLSDAMAPYLVDLISGHAHRAADQAKPALSNRRAA
jgi:pimeloyl-ACP methyl ester carboxylesterase